MRSLLLLLLCMCSGFYFGGCGTGTAVNPTKETFDDEPPVEIPCANCSWYDPNISDSPSPSLSYAESPSAALGANGDAIIAWIEDSKIFKSVRRQGVWTHPLSSSDFISINFLLSVNPKVAMDAHGNAIVVWYQHEGSNWRVYMAQYRNGIWTKPSSSGDSISPATTDASGEPVVAMDSNGNAIIAWTQVDDLGQTQIFKSEFRSGVWNHPTGLTDNISPNFTNAGGPQVVMSDAGYALITWRQSNGTIFHVYKSEYLGDTWYHPGSLAATVSITGVTATKASIATNATGQAAIVWTQSGRLLIAENRTGFWDYPDSTTDGISPAGTNAEDPRVCMSPSGNTFVTWHQPAASVYRIMLSQLINGTWNHPTSTDQAISPVGGLGAGNPAIACDGTENVVIAWMQDPNGPRQIYRSHFRNGNWEHPALTDYISPLGLELTFPPVVASNSLGQSLIVWHQAVSGITKIFFSEFK